MGPPMQMSEANALKLCYLGEVLYLFKHETVLQQHIAPGNPAKPGLPVAYKKWV